MDDINRVTGEDELNKDNSLSETGSPGSQVEPADFSSTPEDTITTGDSMGTGTAFNERLDSELDSDTSGFDETAGDSQKEGFMDKAKDKYREIMSDDK